MKQITILLSSALTLLLITSNNASYAAVYAKYDGIQAQQPNMNVFKGQVRQGNVLNRNVRILPNRNSGGQVGFRDPTGHILWNAAPDGSFGGQEGEAFNPTSKYSISDGAVITPKPNSNNVGLDTGPIYIPGDTFIPDRDQKGVQLKFIDGEWR